MGVLNCGARLRSPSISAIGHFVWLDQLKKFNDLTTYFLTRQA